MCIRDKRGYVGSGEHFRHLIAAMRPRTSAEAYLRLRTLPGAAILRKGAVDEGGVDHHFEHQLFGQALQPLALHLSLIHI